MTENAFFNQEVLSLLRQAGWFPGRNVGETIDYPSDVNYPIDTQMLLNEYGKLFVRSTGAGVNMGRNSIDFDPSWADQESSEDGRLHYYSELIGTTLYPIGYIRDESLFLCVDSSHKVYMAGDNLYWMGNSFVEGISNILLGISGKIFDEQEIHWIE
ncbi:SUKH-3 domain-containing protein [Hymenobacter weizhouensis]|uniref:SUKH-3 domain-containing protein n=1 Tax=Hymenobacter sp. YIM 151500-1 TaxID=2987689 RepID=UPI0022271DDC|nr:SUKH-3 domain-containing protein [Hymenobacter sp. YIM 151500-1]UYZ62614.1 SUKH-3 domain-containing protein [Hymenobacter sp. YIM 151500-1]